MYARSRVCYVKRCFNILLPPVAVMCYCQNQIKVVYFIIKMRLVDGQAKFGIAKNLELR